MASFYIALSLIGFFWHGAAQDSNDIWRVDPSQTPLTMLWTPLVGVAFGLATVQLFRALEGRMHWIPELHREFRDLFGEPPPAELLLLAVASSVGEELLFRGAMLDAWGIWISSAVFALLHVPPRKELWPWTVSSFVMGVAFAGMTWLTGNLGAAVAAHFVVNFLNLRYITRNAPLPVQRPVRPASN